MQTIKLLLLSSFIIILTACSDHGHSDDDNSHSYKPTKHDTIN